MNLTRISGPSKISVSPKTERVVAAPTLNSPEISDQFQAEEKAELEPLVLPPLVKHTSEALKRGYLWNAASVPGPVEAVLGVVLNFGPLARWMGLEPPPKGEPQPLPIGLSWTQSEPKAFAAKAQDIESKLRAPEATEIGKSMIRAGSNENYLVTLSTGVSAVWTPLSGEKIAAKDRPNIPNHTQAQREEAAYLVDKRLGHLVRVPPAVSSGLEGRAGSMKFFVSQACDANNLAPSKLESTITNNDYRKIALFDHIIGNLDRHKGNFLVDKDYHPIAIDHGLSFPVKNSDQGFSNFKFDSTFQLSTQEKELLSKFKEERKDVETELKSLLEPEAIGAMFARVDRMLELGWVSHEWRESKTST